MTNAVTEIAWYGGSVSEPAGVNAEDLTGIAHNREDSRAGTGIGAGIPIPTTPQTVFGWPKLVALNVTTAGTTTISNRRIWLDSPPPTGVRVLVKGVSAYTQPSDSGRPADIGSDGGTPSGYTVVPSSTPLPVYDATAVSSAAVGRNGTFAQLVLAIDSTYGTDGGTSGLVTLPGYRITYDEA